jgi:hypothetical protein
MAKKYRKKRKSNRSIDFDNSPAKHFALLFSVIFVIVAGFALEKVIRKS